MLGWQHMYMEVREHLDVRVPVLFMEMRGIEPPCLEVLADAQGADDFLYLILECHDGQVIEMIPMVVAHDQDIDVRDICRGVDIAAWKGTVGEKDG